MLFGFKCSFVVHDVHIFEEEDGVCVRYDTIVHRQGVVACLLLHLDDVAQLS